MPIGELHTLRSELVQVGRGYFGVLYVVRVHVAKVEIVNEDEGDVRGPR